MNDDLIYEKRDHTAFLTLNRESRRNAISRDMITAFLDYLDTAHGDDAVRAVCITGAGEKIFCSGADLGSTLAKGEDRLTGPRNYARLLKEMAAFPKPLVARVNGACLAGGIGFMLSCDIVISRDDIYFQTPEVNVGIFPMMVGALLFKNVTTKKAMDMVLTGRKIRAPEAEQMGLITRAVTPAHLDQEVQTTLDLLQGKSPMGMRLGKEAFHRASDMPFESAVDFLCEALGRAISTQDAMEGMKAFMEKREPRFTGK
ncbi:MAG: enoyl-CoA hydratase/isomerase family protein [Desulfobacteraceae bacterium]